MAADPVALLIPAYRPSARLFSLLREIQDLDAERVFSRTIVVDDGSGPEHAAVFAALEALPRVSVLRHAVNLGKGAALKSGFNHLFVTGTERAVVTADADGQHRAEDILRVGRESAANPGALVLGVRAFGRDVPLRSLFGNQLTRLVLNFVSGMKLSDTQTGLRGWPRDLALAGLTIAINGYDFETEALVRAKEVLAERFALREVPIATIYEEGNRGSHFDPLWDSMRIYFVLLRFSGAALATAIVDNVVFVSAFGLGLDVLTSQLASRSSGALVSFLLSRNVVFHSRANWAIALSKFLGLVALFGVISYGMIRFAAFEMGMNVVAAKLSVELVLFLASFAIQREFIFAPRPRGP